VVIRKRKKKIAELDTHAERKNAREAKRYLLNSADSSYKFFYKERKKFLRKIARARAAAGGDGDDEYNDDEDIFRRRYKLPLNYIESVGIECAIWPHFILAEGYV